MLRNCDEDVTDSEAPNDDEDNIAEYGRLYSYAMIEDIETAYPGYLVPTATEWLKVLESLGDYAEKNTIAAKLKEAGLLHWNTPNDEHSTNESGFTALGAGLTDGSTFSQFKTKTLFMSSTKAQGLTPDNSTLYFLMLEYDSTEPYAAAPYGLFTAYETYMTSVRLIKGTKLTVVISVKAGEAFTIDSGTGFAHVDDTSISYDVVLLGITGANVTFNVYKDAVLFDSYVRTFTETTGKFYHDGDNAMGCLIDLEEAIDADVVYTIELEQ